MNLKKKIKILFIIACLLGINGVFGAVAMDKNVKYDKMENVEQEIENTEFKHNDYKNILAKYGEELKKGGRVEEFENEYMDFLKKCINFVKNSKLKEKLKERLENNDIKYVKTPNSSKPKIKATYKGIRENFINLYKDLEDKVDQNMSLIESMVETYNSIKPYIKDNALYKISDCEFRKLANEFAECINSFGPLIRIERDLLLLEKYHYDMIQFGRLLNEYIGKFKKILNSSNIKNAKRCSKTYKDFNQNTERFNKCIEKIENVRNRDTIDFVEGNLDEHLQLFNQFFEKYKNLYNEINLKSKMQKVERNIKEIEDEINKSSKKLTDSNFSLEEIKNCINCTVRHKKNLKNLNDEDINEVLKNKIYTLLNEIDKIQNLTFENINQKIETNISKLKNKVIPKLEEQKKCDGYEKNVDIQKDIDEAKNLVVDLEDIKQEMPDLTKLKELNNVLSCCEKNYNKLNTIYDEFQKRSEKFESLNNNILYLRKELEKDTTKKPESDLENELEEEKQKLENKEKNIEKTENMLSNL